MRIETPFTHLSDRRDLLDLIDDVVNAPTVTLLVDLVSLRPYMTRSGYSIGKSGGNLADGLLRFGTQIGRVNQIVVVGDGDPVDYNAWERVGVVVRCPSMYSGSQVDHILYCDAIESLTKRPSKIYLFCTDSSKYTELARRVKHYGYVAALASPLKAGPMREMRQHCQLAFCLDDILAVEDHFDVENFDYSALIRQMDRTEQKLPFVGLRYFIDQIMPGLGGLSGDVNVSSRVMDQAKEIGLVTVYEVPNKHPSLNKVAAVRLNREHAAVVEALAPVEAEVGDEEELDAED